MEQEETKELCHLCGKAPYITGREDKYCPNCFYSPERRQQRPRKKKLTEWEYFWHQRSIAIACGKRGYCVGGWKNAYIGTGEYEYNYDEGYFIKPRY